MLSGLHDPRETGQVGVNGDRGAGEGIGGLRDLHLAQWLATVALPSTRGDVWRQLVRLGVISRNNARRVAECREFLLCVRNWMHFEAGRHADILVRDRQERLAVALGFEDDERASRVEAARP